LGLLLGLGAPQSAVGEPGSDFQTTPSLRWSQGDHRVDLGIATRWRWEYWDARAPASSNMAGGRTRFDGKYTWRDQLSLFAQGQHAYVGGLSAASSGVAAAYRANTPGGDNDHASAVKLSQLWLEWKPTPRSSLRGGRHDINRGTGLKYDEKAWKFLKTTRLSQRLVGTVGWTHGARSYDGGSASVTTDSFYANAFVAQPTTGVFDIDSGYGFQSDVLVGALDLVARRGSWLPNTELAAFFVGFRDHRDPVVVAGLFGDIDVYTLGVQSLGIYPLGPGSLDVTLWLAYQFGDYVNDTPSGVRRLDQRAWAVIGELGYRLTEIPGKPWIRTGVNAASGDSNPDNGRHGTFFNVLPTNHMYYGYVDQLALQNLVNWFAQFEFAPHPKLGISLFVHKFWLTTANDGRYFGTGAFNKTSLGFGATPSNGSRKLGTEVDVVARYAVNRWISLSLGYAHLFGGSVFTAPDRDTRFAFAQILIRY
jgi:hypothetical protein